MKASRFNHHFRADDGKWLLYNQVSKALSVIREEDFAHVCEILENPACGDRYPDLFNPLVQGQFLVEDMTDERKLLRVLHQQERYDNQRLHLVLFPSFECDFACSYCFQRQLSKLGYEFRGSMSDSVVTAIVNYVRKAVPRIQRFTADWMGGEPLTALNRVLTMSHAFKSLCEDELCEYRSQITTNGYMLSRETAQRLVGAGIRGAMVTIDGPPEFHNRRRKLKSGEGTFARILENIVASAELFASLKIRTNVDSENVTHLKHLVTILEESGLNRPNVSLVFAMTTINESCGTGLCRVSDALFLAETIDASRFAFERDFHVLRPDKDSTVRCWATTRGTFAITPTGDVHKCASFAGDKKHRDGYLDLDLEEVHLEDQAVEWLAWDPFDDPECRACRFLPVCFGGCPYDEIVSKLDAHAMETPSRDSLEDCKSWSRQRLETALLHEYHVARKGTQ